VSKSGNIEPVLVLDEVIDLSNVDKLIHSHKLRNLAGDDNMVMYESYRRLLRIAAFTDGKVPVAYRQQEDGYGRLTATVAVDDGRGALPSLTTMKREVRAILAAKNYHDVDFVNCHPVILEQVLNRHFIPCPMLSKYVAERESCIQDVMATCGVSRDAAKSLFLRLIFLGSIEAWIADELGDNDGATRPPPQWVFDLRDELVSNAERLVMRPELDELRDARIQPGRVSTSAWQQIPAKALSSLLSVYLQTIERRCLDGLYSAVLRDGYEVGALIYDGMLVRKAGNSDNIPKSMLKTWRAHVLCETGYDIEIKVKELVVDESWLLGRCPKSPPGPAAQDPPAVESDPYWDDSWMDGSVLMTYAQMKARWELRSLKIIVFGDYMREEREKHIIYNRSKLIDAYEHLKYSEFVTCASSSMKTLKLQKHSFIKAWIADEDIRTKKYIDIYPPPLACPSHVYNMWTGFAVEKFNPVKDVDTNSQAVLAFIEHLHILMNRDRASTDYILDWIAQIFQQPSRKTGIALLLKGSEGVGKNRFTDILKLMIGDGLFLETAKLASVLFGRFTDARKGRFLVILNEAKGADSHSANDELKDMITSETFVWEAKGRDGVQMRAYDRFIFTTNNSNCIKINPDSRRFVVFEVSSELKGNTAYFKQLSTHMDDPHSRYEFYMHLMQRDISNIGVDVLPLPLMIDDQVDTSSKSERRFQREIERCTGLVFEKVRPVWLKNPATNECMELDMYDKDRKFAIEYNGIQHYKFPNPFHKTLQEFQAQQQRDVAKARICQEHGVVLISVKASNVYEEVDYTLVEMHKLGVMQPLKLSHRDV
jgi:hypothetical protein